MQHIMSKCDQYKNINNIFYTFFNIPSLQNAAYPLYLTDHCNSDYDISSAQ